MQSPRYLLAFALAPAVPALGFALVMSPLGPVWSLADMLGIAAIAAAFTYPIAIALGLPVVVLLLEFRQMKLPYLLVAAALMGCVPGPIFLGMSMPLGWLFFAGMGVVTGLAWWFISGVSSTHSLNGHAV